MIYEWTSLHLVEEGNVKLAKLIIDSIALTNNPWFSSNTDQSYSYIDTFLKKIQFFFALTLNERLTFTLYLHQFMLINVNIAPTQLFIIVIYVKHMVVTMLVPPE